MARKKIELTGKICKYKKDTVLVISEYKKKVTASKNIKLDRYYYVMFPNQGIDVLSEKCLEII